jgi:gluconolactonase
MPRCATLAGFVLCCLACSARPKVEPTGDGGAKPATAGGNAQMAADSGSGAKAGSPALASDASLPAAPAADAQPQDARPIQPQQPRDASDHDDAGALPPDSGPTMPPDARRPSAPSLVCPSGVSYPNPLPNDKQAKLIKNGFGFLEGPLWIAEGQQLLFTDMDFTTASNPNGPNAMIRRFHPPDTFDVFVASSGSNGLALANDGRVLAASHDVQSLSYFELASGQREVRALDYQGKHFNSPNDVALRSDGHVYFTDPDYQIGPRTSETGMRAVYHVSPDGMVTLLDGSLNQPNGVALSPDEHTLYVGSADNDIFAWQLAADGGTTGERKVFASPGPSDGLGIDCAGNLYVTAMTVQVFDPTGHKLGDITTAEPPANVAFGGPRRTTLYITAETGLYSIELNVPGRCY